MIVHRAASTPQRKTAPSMAKENAIFDAERQNVFSPEADRTASKSATERGV